MLSIVRTGFQKVAAHQWDEKLVKKLGVSFKIGDASEVIVKPKDLPMHTRTFLDQCIDALQRKGQTNTFSSNLNNMMERIGMKTHREIDVDNVAEELVKGSMPGSQLKVVRQHGLWMKMSGGKQRVIPDLAVLLENEPTKALMVVENKRATAKVPTVQSMKNTSSQVLAQAIAASQQKSWPRGRQNFMMTCIGTHVMFHEGLSDERLLHRVEKGQQFRGEESEKTVITTYAKTMKNGYPVPWEISNVRDLSDVVGMLAYIGADIARWRNAGKR